MAKGKLDKVDKAVDRAGYWYGAGRIIVDNWHYFATAFAIASAVGTAVWRYIQMMAHNIGWWVFPAFIALLVFAVFGLAVALRWAVRTVSKIDASASFDGSGQDFVVIDRRVEKSTETTHPVAVHRKMEAIEKDDVVEISPSEFDAFEYNMKLLENEYKDFSRKFVAKISTAQKNIQKTIECISSQSRALMCIDSVEREFDELNMSVAYYLAAYESFSKDHVELSVTMTFNEDDHYWVVQQFGFLAPYHVAIRDLEVFKKKSETELRSIEGKIRKIKKAYFANPNAVIAELTRG